MTEKIAVIGTGLMGASLALALKDAGCAYEVAAYDISGETRDAAVEMGVADNVYSHAVDAAAGADFIFLATPMKAMAGALEDCAHGIGRGAIVSDLGSAKERISKELACYVPEGAFFIGGHPMAGSEHSGVRFASVGMFADRYYILTPTRETSPDALQALHGLLTGIGARVITMDPETHDRAMATVSHVPHLLSLLLMDMAAREQETIKSVYTVAAGGFRDMTRIAGSDLSLWADIIDENRVCVIERLKDYASGLRGLIDLLEQDRAGDLVDMFARSKAARDSLSAKPGAELADLYVLSLPVPDEPGVISLITTAIGSLGVNIEDVQITHPLEGETGTLSMEVLGDEASEKAASHLASLGYRISRGKA